ncbi:MAG: desulfoferrodoxin [Candidatus Cloacimonetes bacterium]|nr:desulfoferrodoxin [Candidatus Cloacimonadota bacterium]NLO10903.1 desulfoferrodoxin [Candidatus Cloacimonadota bacterium]
MTKLREIYHCALCGNVTEVVFTGGGELVCCGQPMNLLVENTEEAAYEKHIPVITDMGDKIKVAVGSVPHPMEEKHYIAFVEVITEKCVYRHEFKPGDAPEAIFPVSMDKVLYAREYCNLHGLWKSD